MKHNLFLSFVTEINSYEKLWKVSDATVLSESPQPRKENMKIILHVEASVEINYGHFLVDLCEYLIENS